MYAVIISGGKQYRVKEGQLLKLEKLPSEVGESVLFDKVLLIKEGEKSTVGLPYVAGSQVTATVERHGRHDKIKIIKFRRRKHHMKHQGHRQHFTEVRITAISA